LCKLINFESAKILFYHRKALQFFTFSATKGFNPHIFEADVKQKAIFAKLFEAEQNGTSKNEKKKDRKTSTQVQTCGDGC